jgi:putative lumazine-binding protein
MHHDDKRAPSGAGPRAIALIAIAAALAMPLRAQSGATAATREDREAVRRAVLDYVEGFYEGDSTKLARSVRPEIYKYGFWRPRDSTTFAGEQMAFPEFFAYARRVRQTNHQAPPTAPKTIELFDVQNQTASAKLTAFWGTDYLLLGKYDGKWMISSVLWQSRPADASR